MLAMSTRSLLGCRFAEWHHPRRRGSLPKTPECQAKRSMVGPDVSVEDISPWGRLEVAFTSDEPFRRAVRRHGVLDGGDANREWSLTEFPLSFDSAAGGGVSTTTAQELRAEIREYLHGISGPGSAMPLRDGRRMGLSMSPLTQAHVAAAGSSKVARLGFRTDDGFDA